MTPRRIYLDYNATSPVHPLVCKELVSALGGFHGNPSSPHREGRLARDLLEEARSQVAACLGVEPDEVYFTSGGTEGNNIAAALGETTGATFFTTSVEHPSMLEPARRRWRRGLPGAELRVNHAGVVGVESLSAVPPGAVVSIQWINNETGVVQDLATLSRAVKARGAIVHTDGSQGFLRVPCSMADLGVDSATISAHKALGPGGIGALYLKRGVLADPVLLGGAQERRVRPGTENVLGACGLGRLAALASGEGLWDWDRIAELRAGFVAQLLAIPGAELNAPSEITLANTVSLALDGLHAETVLAHLDRAGVAASSGSACARGESRPSHVLKAMSRPDTAIRGTLRFSFGPGTSGDDLVTAATTLRRIVETLRG